MSSRVHVVLTGVLGARRPAYDLALTWAASAFIGRELPGRFPRPPAIERDVFASVLDRPARGHGTAAGRAAALSGTRTVRPSGTAFVGMLDAGLDDRSAADRHSVAVCCPHPGESHVVAAFVRARADDPVSFRSAVCGDGRWATALSLAEGTTQVDVEDGARYRVAREEFLALRVTPPFGAASAIEMNVTVTRR